MNIEKAREINKHENERGSWEWLRNFIGKPFCKTFECESIFGEAKGYIEGYESREEEVKELKTVLENIIGVTPRKGAVNEWCREVLKKWKK